MGFWFGNRKKRGGIKNWNPENYGLILLPGVPKCGTSSMFSDLVQFQDVISNRCKEVNLPLNDEVMSTTWFEKVNPEKVASGWLIDASQNYCWDVRNRDLEYLAEQKFRDIRVILMYRNPIFRAASNYEMNKKQHGWKPDFKEAWRDYCDEKGQRIMGNYLAFYRKNCKLFGEEHVKVVLSEEYFGDRTKVLSEVREFLGVEGNVESFTQEIISPMNEEGPAQYDLNDELYERLKKSFEKRIGSFERHLGIHTNWLD